MDVKAAVAFAAGQPLSIETVQLAGPQAGEVVVELKATGLCHTDKFTLSGEDPEGEFPVILGHEGAGVVVDVGPDVKHLKKGDHVIPLYTPECRECEYCLNPKTNLCQKIRSTQGKGLMPNGSSRFSFEGKPLLHYMGCSTFANYTVVPEIALAKIRDDAPFDKVCYIGCGVTTGVGAAIWAAKVQEGQTVAVIGCGGVGISVLQGCRIAKAENIVAIDLNPDKRKIAHEFGATHSIDPSEVDPAEFLRELTDGRGADVAFEAVGHTGLQRQAYDMTRPGGVCCWVGVSKVGDEASIPSSQVVLENKSIVGTMYGSANVKQDFVKLVDFIKKGELDVKKMVSRELALEEVNDAFRAMLEGEVIRSVIRYD